MKTIKFILSAILMMMAFTIQAQTIQVYKDGVVVKEYPASEVKSVEVKPVYYYYAGWECPKNEEDLAEFVKNANGINAIGGEADMTKSTIVDFTGNRTDHDEAQFYIVIPTGCKIRNLIETDVTTSFFNIISTIGNHTVYQRKAKSDMIPDFHITKS